MLDFVKVMILMTQILSKSINNGLAVLFTVVLLLVGLESMLLGETFVRYSELCT